MKEKEVTKAMTKTDYSQVPFDHIISTLNSLREQGKSEEAEQFEKGIQFAIQEIEQMIADIKKELKDKEKEK
ncbi:MAG: hypothetical protein ACLPX5_07280 [Dissulfurispiraceae bacterium]